MVRDTISYIYEFYLSFYFDGLVSIELILFKLLAENSSSSDVDMMVVRLLFGVVQLWESLDMSI